MQEMNHKQHIRRTHIIPHHLKGVKQNNKNIKKILMYLKLIVFSVQYVIRARTLLDFCGNGSQEKGVALKVKLKSYTIHYYKITKRGTHQKQHL